MFKIISNWLKNFDTKVLRGNEVSKLNPEEGNVLKKFIDELKERTIKNFEGFDKAILSISSAGVGWLLVNIEKSGMNEGGLKLIVIFFCVSILSTVLSFYFAIEGNKRHEKELVRCLREGTWMHLVTDTTWQMKVVRFLNGFSLTSFVFALVSICCVVICF